MAKVIIHKSRSEVSLVEQPTIECVPIVYLKFIFKFQSKNFWGGFSPLFYATFQCGGYKKNLKK